MAEGTSRVNQQVADIGHWAASDRLTSDDRVDGPGRHVPARSKQAKVPSGVLQVVEADIIPRVVLARREDQDLAGLHCVPDTLDIARFAQIILAPDGAAKAASFVDSLRLRGFSIEDVYLRLLQPTARHVGDLWTDDLCTFVDVTLALGLLHQMLRDLSPTFQKDAGRFDARRQALLVPLPGDHHTFGLSIVAEFFRRSAWSVWSAPFASSADLGDVLRESWFTVVGFSVSCVERLDELSAAIRLVRSCSCNAAVGVLVGGPLFVDHPDYVTRVGADVMGRDARQALFQAECFASQMGSP